MRRAKAFLPYGCEPRPITVAIPSTGLRQVPDGFTCPRHALSLYIPASTSRPCRNQSRIVSLAIEWRLFRIRIGTQGFVTEVSTFRNRPCRVTLRYRLRPELVVDRLAEQKERAALALGRLADRVIGQMIVKRIRRSGSCSKKRKARQVRARKHWAHTISTEITRSYGGVVVGRLCTGNMTRRTHLVGLARKRGLNRAILNVGWHRFEAMPAYKAARFVKVDPAYTSRTCASCGTVDRRSRESQASFVCTACGHRD